MPVVRLDKVSLSFGLKPLLDAADLHIRRSERVCLLGRNGEGKSSLLQLITRQIVPDGGEVWVAPRLPGSRASRKRYRPPAMRWCAMW